MEQIALSWLDARDERLQIFRERHRENVEGATFEILHEWRDQHPYPESRQELYQIFVRASKEMLLHIDTVQFLKEPPK